MISQISKIENGTFVKTEQNFYTTSVFAYLTSSRGVCFGDVIMKFQFITGIISVLFIYNAECIVKTNI